MSRSFNLSQLKWKDPRVGMRALLGVLLLANLVAAVIAFKPFGGGADDLRRDRQRLQQQLAQLQAQVAHSRRLAAKVQTARTEGDRFLKSFGKPDRLRHSSGIAHPRWPASLIISNKYLSLCVPVASHRVLHASERDHLAVRNRYLFQETISVKRDPASVGRDRAAARVDADLVAARVGADARREAELRVRPRAHVRAPPDLDF